MRERGPLRYEALPLASKLRLDQACQAFEAAWQAPSIEAFLEEVEPEERMAFAQQLVLLDLDHRLEDYLARFPELDRAWLLRAWAGDGEDDKRTTPHLRGEKADESSPRWEQKEAGASSREVAGGNRRFGEYELLELIGRGGMGVVYKARQVKLNRPVAIKMILAGEHASEASVQRFRVEAEAAARVQHEGIVRVYDVGTHDGRPYLVMEYVEGGSLKDRLDGTPWACRQAALLLEGLARVIQAAHARQIIHRDLKPGNILLTPEGQVKVTDFGLAKLVDEGGALTVSGEVLGTPSYMAPEQARGQSKEATPAVDVYALGAILYELLTGKPPFRGATAADTLLQVVRDKPVPLRLLNSQIDRDLETVCLKCLEKEPAQRYPSPAALAEDLGRYRDHRSIHARPPGWADALARGLSRRHYLSDFGAGGPAWARLSLAAAFVVLASNLAVSWLVHTRQPKEIWWAFAGATWSLLGGTFFHFLWPRRHALTRADCQVLCIWGGYGLGTMVLWVALGTPYDRGCLTTHYPAVAVMTGLGYFVQGSIYWGRFYVLGLLFFGLAIVMRATPDWASAEMALLHSSSLAGVGWYLLRNADREQETT